MYHYSKYNKGETVDMVHIYKHRICLIKKKKLFDSKVNENDGF
jgi:hypothetical protein